MFVPNMNIHVYLWFSTIHLLYIYSYWNELIIPLLAIVYLSLIIINHYFNFFPRKTSWKTLWILPCDPQMVNRVNCWCLRSKHLTLRGSRKSNLWPPQPGEEISRLAHECLIQPLRLKIWRTWGGFWSTYVCTSHKIVYYNLFGCNHTINHYLEVIFNNNNNFFCK